MGTEQPRSNEMVSVDEAFQALHYFLDAYWERGNRSENQIAIL